MARPHRIAVLTLVALVAGCHGSTPGSDGGSDAGPQDAGSSTVVVSPAAATVFAGGPPLVLSASVLGSSETPRWSLQPAGSGTLSATSGATVTFQPPASVQAETKLTLTARVSSPPGSGSATLTVEPTGSLDVTLTVPNGAPGSVVITGPNGFNHLLTTTQTLSALVPGFYGAIAQESNAPGPVVDTIYEPSSVVGSPAQVNAGATGHVEVAYGAPRPGTGMLWVPDFSDGALIAYSAAQLSTDTTGPAELVMADAGLAALPEAIAFDGSGNLWYTDLSQRRVGRYLAKDLLASSVSQPSLTLKDVPLDGGGSSLPSPEGLAFDFAGDLWVASSVGQVVAYSPQQLLTGGKVAPFLTVLSAALPDGGPSLQGCYDVAVDSSGRLWVSNFGPGTLVAYSGLGQLSGVVAPVPDVVISDLPLADGGHTLEGPEGIAFDSAGNAWVGNWSAGTVIELTRDQLAASGAPLPAAILGPVFADGGSFGSVGGVALDNGGDLWVMSSNGLFQVLQPTRAADPLSPAVSITNTPSIDMGKVAFDPTPASLPLGQ